MAADLLLVVQLAIGFTFLRSSLGKVLKPAPFFEGLAAYEILPRWLSYPAGILLIIVEVLIAISHLSGWMFARVTFLTLGLLGVFLFVALRMLHAQAPVACLCFGAGDTELLTERSIARIGILAIGELVLLLQLPQLLRLWGPDGLPFSVLLPAATSAVLAVVATSWILTTGDLVVLTRRCLKCSRRSR